jgi:hypothetical protein
MTRVPAVFVSLDDAHLIDPTRAIVQQKLHTVLGALLLEPALEWGVSQGAAGNIAALEQVCDLYAVLILRWTSNRPGGVSLLRGPPADLLDAIARLQSRSWRHIDRTGQVESLLSRVWALLERCAPLDSRAPATTAFACIATSHVLTFVDDVQVHERSFPFSVEQLGGMIRQLRSGVQSAAFASWDAWRAARTRVERRLGGTGITRGALVSAIVKLLSSVSRLLQPEWRRA